MHKACPTALVLALVGLLPTAMASDFVLLANGSVLEGRIEPWGEGFRLHLDPQSWVLLSRPEVLCVAGDKKGLLDFQRKQLAARDVDGLLKLVQWCVRCGLLDEGKTLLAELRRFSPHRPELDALETMLHQEVQPRPRGITTVTEPRRTTRPPLPPASSETLREFTRHVQPILLNRCSNAGCHSGSHASEPTLRMVRGPGPQPRSITLANLQSIQQVLNLEQPEKSPLLLAARQAHGGAREAPLDLTDRVAFERLVNWIRRASHDSVARALSPSQPGRTEMPSSETELDAPFAAELDSSSSADPLDPERFNREFLEPEDSAEGLESAAPVGEPQD